MHLKSAARYSHMENINSVCIVIHQVGNTFHGYVPLLHLEVTGSSQDEVKKNAKIALRNIQLHPSTQAVITFVDIDK